jgi:ComF family protein
VLKDWWIALLDLIYPPVCPLCRKSIAEHDALCRECLRKVLANRRLNVLYRKLGALDACHIICEYSGGINVLLGKLKFQDQPRYAKYCGRILEDCFDVSQFGPIDIVVPVPLHPKRLAARGYNQTTMIFFKWAKSREMNWCEALERIRATEPQWELEQRERLKNIKGAFQLTRQELVEGKTVLLVDDITTTGTTLNECAKTLKKGGATKVIGLAFASDAGK